MTPQLCLGTAQFGKNYGLLNSSGKILETAAADILRFAESQDISYIDTAQAYGDAEQTLGKILTDSDHFKVITKIKVPANTKNQGLHAHLETVFEASLKKLKTRSIEALMLHSSDVLQGDKASIIIDWLDSLIARKAISRYGVSIYDSSELSYIPLDKFKLFQIPLSIYDQRFLCDGTINLLQDAGASIHARSIFMQGVVLAKSNDLPDFFTEEFCKHHHELQKYLALTNQSALDISLHFIKSINSIEATLIGIDSLPQLKQICRSWATPKPSLVVDDFSRFAWNVSSDLDPRQWKP